MADDDRSPDVAGWLEVEPLDEVTRRRLVATALAESADGPQESPTARPSRAWRWLAAAAVVVVVLVVGLAVLTAEGGHDDSTVASRQDSTALAPQSFEQALGAAPNVGDFGNLDDAANLAKLRATLEHPQARKHAESAEPVSPNAAAGATGSASDSAGSQFSTEGCLRGSIGTVVAQGRGTIDGRPVTVVLLEAVGGKQSITALFDDACESRQLFGSG